MDLEWLDAAGMTAAELDAAIHGRLVEVPLGLDGAVVRLVVKNVPSALAHALNHEALRPWRAEALQLHLDLRRPEPPERLVGVGAPTSAHPLAEVVADFLGRRPLDADLDRARLVSLGREYLEEVERALLEGEG
jgi:hypothetical protein